MDFQARFREALVTVWGGAGEQVSFEVRIASELEVFASLSYDSNAAMAEGRRLLRCASHHLLNVSPNLTKQPVDVMWRVILHEAIHVGYPEHDEAFERVAVEVGTASTERQILGLGFEVHRQKANGIFEKVLETFNKDEAFAFAREKRAGAGQYRVTF